ncbi:MAG: lactate racemase domain-containing protein [Candidatus Bipolaricaulota bacterium]
MKSMNPGRAVTSEELSHFIADSLSGFGKADEHVLVVIPDDTRTIPMQEVYSAICSELASRVKRLTFLIALGTHPPMTEDELSHHLGANWQRPDVLVCQHDWQDPHGLAMLGSIETQEVAALSNGLLSEAVAVTINRLALEADRILIVNPVFPHEVAGFSGGHKYFFPGISGAEILDTSHWLGALITNPKVNGYKDTPVRALIERAADMVPTPRSGLAFVMSGHEAVGAFFGDVRETWAEAADLSAKTNIIWKGRSFHTVLSIAPIMYRELWTAGKCMYKLEPVVSDGGKLIIYAPHLREISPTHEQWIRQVGYHTRDYFIAQWDKYEHVPRAILAHSTHVKGIGSFVDGIERPRVEVVLATGISEEVCKQINLGYMDPDELDIRAYEDRENEGILLVSNAGEMLYRLSDGSVPR